MEKYYLPIEINNGRNAEDSRWHMCHLDEYKKGDSLPKAEGKFSFIVDRNAEMLFKIPYKATFISNRGGSCKNVEVRNIGEKYGIFKDVNNVLGVELAEKVPKGRPYSNKCNYGDDNGNIEITRERESQDYIIKVNRVTVSQSLDFVIKLHRKDDREYVYAFKIHLCDTASPIEFLEVAVDFGSEASQVWYKRGNDLNGVPIDLVGAFQNFHLFKDNPPFWQKDNLNDYLFKTIFFVNKDIKEKGFKYEDVPFCNGCDTFILMLKGYISHGKKQEFLPNLKLMEYMTVLEDTDIKVIVNRNNVPVYEVVSDGNNNVLWLLRNEKIEKSSLLRLILNHILHSILNRHVENVSSEKYLRITLLMPNVYSQEKVYKVIKDLYADFYKILEEYKDTDDYRKYSCFKGIEVQMLSESDAAFLGTLRFRNELNFTPAENSHYLVIDAGKGTTDFSILKCLKDKNFDSVYRTGIPVGGHVLTVAFVTALDKYLRQKGAVDNLKEIVFDAKDEKQGKQEIVSQFMECVEDLKKNYRNGQEMPQRSTTTLSKSIKEKLDELVQFKKSQSVSADSTYAVMALEKINEILGIVKNNGKQIFGTGNEIDSKVTELVNEITKKIEIIKQDSKIEKFDKVIFSGRGFLFEPFREKVAQMLMRKGINVIENLSNDIVRILDNDNQGKLAKTISVQGALAIGESSINRRSELIGIPQIVPTDLYNELGLKNNWQKIFGVKSKNRRKRHETEELLIEGMKVDSRYKSFDVRVGARSHHFSNKAGSRFYFLGDKFIIQHKKGEMSFKEDYQLDGKMSNLFEDSQFPLHRCRNNAEVSHNGEDNTEKGPDTHEELNFKTDESKKKKKLDDYAKNDKDIDLSEGL